jgi:hypothetical protein
LAEQNGCCRAVGLVVAAAGKVSNKHPLLW